MIYAKPIQRDEMVAGVRIVECPFCHSTLSWDPPSAHHAAHACDVGIVYLMNGHAIAGAARYNREESRQARIDDK